MPYIYHSDDERKQMLDFIGLKSEDALFAKIPDEFVLREPLALGREKPRAKPSACSNNSAPGTGRSPLRPVFSAAGFMIMRSPRW